MRAGKLSHPVTIQRDAGVVNSSGQVIPNWVTYAERRAGIRPLSGREYMQAQSLGAEVTHEVAIRYDQGVTSGMRVLHNGRILEIESVMNIDEKNIDMILMCKEG